MGKIVFIVAITTDLLCNTIILKNIRITTVHPEVLMSILRKLYRTKTHNSQQKIGILLKFSGVGRGGGGGVLLTSRNNKP